MAFDQGVAMLPPLIVAIPILMACLVLVCGRVLPHRVIDAVAVATAGAVVALLAVLLAHTGQGRIITWAAHWEPHHGYSVGIVLVGDPVGVGIALLAACLAVLALVFSIHYFDAIDDHYQCLMLLFLAGMVGLSLTGDLFDMFVFFELMGAAAYGLTGIKVEDESALQGALNFGIINSLAAYLSLVGIGLLFARTGNLGLPQLGRDLAHHAPDQLIVAAFVLVLTAFLVKGAMVPFHFWLADAHAVAPTPACVLFSGAMVPIGIYSAFRIYWVVFAGSLPTGEVRRSFIVLGAVTALLGAIMALSQRHLKRLLAYSTIAHVGLFLIALGCLTESGTAGAIIYIAGHAGVKSALFLLAGVTLNRYGSVDEIELFGAGKGERVLGLLIVLGGLALAGLPPFGTALGKAMSEDAGSAAGYVWVPALFVAVSAMTGGAVLRAAGRIYFGLGSRPREDDEPDRAKGTEQQDIPLDHVPATMIIPIAVLLAGALTVGVLPGARTAADRAAAFFIDRIGYIRQALDGAHVVTTSTAVANWTGIGIGLGFASALAAIAIAAVSLAGPNLSRRLPRLRDLHRPLGLLHRVHSGHVGDYVAWLVMGMAVLAGFVGLPLVR
ncbi:MAG TPA: complex I subunit 5 family protein [Acidimicrobiales bacterium]|jgi:multicomponent Na+:H+ antiporter subunit D|nr:complex I subunit 5 family protein [Acidimicrobiales bacterium]